TMPAPSTALRRGLLVLICLVLAGCQSLPFQRQQGESAPPAGSIGQAIELLQDGDEDRAERRLADFLERNPGSATARLLLAQIRQPPEDLLGETFEEIEVQPGDSLSAIA